MAVRSYFRRSFALYEVEYRRLYDVGDAEYVREHQLRDCADIQPDDIVCHQQTYSSGELASLRVERNRQVNAEVYEKIGAARLDVKIQLARSARHLHAVVAPKLRTEVENHAEIVVDEVDVEYAGCVHRHWYARESVEIRHCGWNVQCFEERSDVLLGGDAAHLAMGALA